jgi:hypothetical protein
MDDYRFLGNSVPWSYLALWTCTLYQNWNNSFRRFIFCLNYKTPTHPSRIVLLACSTSARPTNATEVTTCTRIHDVNEFGHRHAFRFRCRGFSSTSRWFWQRVSVEVGADRKQFWLQPSEVMGFAAFPELITFCFRRLSREECWHFAPFLSLEVNVEKPPRRKCRFNYRRAVGRLWNNVSCLRQ